MPGRDTIRRTRAEDITLRADDTRQVLTVEGLEVTFKRRQGEIKAVRGVDFSLTAGRTLVLLGESGCGKSVTARAILRLYGRSARLGGSVRLGETELTTLDDTTMSQLRGATIGMVPQDPSGSLDPLRAVGAQIVEVLRRHDVEPDGPKARVIAAGLLERVGIHDSQRVLRSFPFELSGGMRQRIAIAIAIACRPRVLIADEPTTALDVTVQAQVLKLFTELQRDLNMALLLVTHDVGVTRFVGDEVAVMYAGRLVETGPVGQVLDRPGHPYTAGLLDAMPLPGIPRGALRAIPGRPPGSDEHVADDACALAPRCAFANAECSHHRPPLIEVAPGQLAACDVVGGVVPRSTPLEAAHA
ncbi:MAG TPA: ABC transporter ATP-binding protein [Conexibacter sp.]|jgi:oligopeptide/dipeptide ABC transporter ATP-binding protein